MSDEESTEDLLNVILRENDAAWKGAYDGDLEACRVAVNKVGDAVWQLLKRGDTLVRSDDLRALLEAHISEAGSYTTVESVRVQRGPRDRIAAALGVSIERRE